MSKIKSKIKKIENKLGKEGTNLSESDENVKKRFKKIQIVAIVSFISILLVLLLTRTGNVTIDSIIENANGNEKKSILSLFALFAVKSLTIIIPLPSLYIASGVLFKPAKALLVSYIGLSITLTIPFILGRWSGAEEMAYLKKSILKSKDSLRCRKEMNF